MQIEQNSAKIIDVFFPVRMLSRTRRHIDVHWATCANKKLYRRSLGYLEEPAMLSTRFFLVLIVTCAVSTDAQGIFRGTCRKEAIFDKTGGERVLQNHVIASHDVTTGLVCAQYCLRTSGCKSYNYQETGSPLHRCELSNHTKSSKPSDYIMKAGFSYHDPVDFVVPKCSSFPCQNGGTCRFVNCGGFFECFCKPEYTGKHCETWFGFNGSTSNLPARSCLNIKLLGQDTGDARYWIDPANTGNPFTVRCDMTTDGGGWTVIRNVTLLSSPTNGYNELTDYRRIASLTTYQFVSQPGLLELKKDMGFTQIRYFCRKVSVGRVFHVMTAKNDLGFDVVRYFVESNDSFPTACNSFVCLPDDNSTLAANCDKWGYSKTGKAMVNKWGCWPYTGAWKPYRNVASWQDVALVAFVQDHYYCDDNANAGQAGDVWQTFVR